jgi:RNA polymerase sigma factor (sigma-70 family)
MMHQKGASISNIEKVYRSRGSDFFRFALARTGDPEAARDAVQEGFARALRSRQTFRGSGSLDAWIVRCVLNAARDLGGRSDWPHPPDAEPEASAEDSAAPAQTIRVAVRSLPHRQREALFLRFYLDFDYAAIAEALDVEIGTVSATLHAAREGLGRALMEVRT